MAVCRGSPISHLSSHILDANVWVHVVMTWDGANKRLYINGSHDKTWTGQTGAMMVVERGWVLAWEDSQAHRYFDGDLDDVRLYDKALSAAEVAAVYAEGRR